MRTLISQGSMTMSNIKWTYVERRERSMANRNKEETKEKKGVSELWINREIRAVCKILKYLCPESILRMVRKSSQNSRPDRTSIPSWEKSILKLFQDLCDRKICKHQEKKLFEIIEHSFQIPFSDFSLPWFLESKSWSFCVMKIRICHFSLNNFLDFPAFMIEYLISVT